MSCEIRGERLRGFKQRSEVISWADLNRLQNSPTWEYPVSLWPIHQHLTASQLETPVIAMSEDNAVNMAERGRAFPKPRTNSR